MKTRKMRFRVWEIIIFVLLFQSVGLAVLAQEVSTFAGSGAAGSVDDSGIAASFNFPTGIYPDSLGNLYIADQYSNKIRKITAAGLVTTLAGSGAPTSIDGTGTSASFHFPDAVCTDKWGNVYVAGGNHKIRKITPAGVVTTIAGSGTAGFADGTGTNASFNGPLGICADTFANLYVADYWNHCIRKISPLGVVTTFAGSGIAGDTDSIGNLASFNFPFGVCSDTAGNIFVADFSNHKIRKITPVGLVTTVAGSGTAGDTDGIAANAEFNAPTGLCVDSLGNIYVADRDNHKIRKISPLGLVTTLAGSGTAGDIDGIGTNARFNAPFSVCYKSEKLYVADANNNKIRTINPAITSLTPPINTAFEVAIYPNPSQAILNIELSTFNSNNSTQIALLNVWGQLLQTTTITTSTTTLNVQHLSKGVYFIKIMTAHQAQMFPFSKE